MSWPRWSCDAFGLNSASAVFWAYRSIASTRRGSTRTTRGGRPSWASGSTGAAYGRRARYAAAFSGGGYNSTGGRRG